MNYRYRLACGGGVTRSARERPFVLIAIVLIAVAVPWVARAQTLTAAFDLSVTNISIVPQRDDTYDITFDVVNGDTRRVEGIALGIKINDQESGAAVYEQPFTDARSIGPLERESEILTFNAAVLPAGTYDVFVVAENESGVTLALGFAGEIRVSERTRARTTPQAVRVSECTLSETAAGMLFSCPVSDTDETLTFEWSLFSRSIYGEQVRAGTMEHTADGYVLNLSRLDLAPGRYELLAALRAADGSIRSRSVTQVFEIRGSWVAIVSHALRARGDGSVDVEVVFDGGGPPRERTFALWLRNSVGDVCAADSFTVDGLLPYTYTRSFSFDDTSTCADVSLAGALYERDIDGNVRIIETVGDADFETLLARMERERYAWRSLRTFAEYPAAAVLGLISGIVLVWLLVRRRADAALVLVVSVAAAALLVPPRADALTFIARHDTFNVTLDNKGVFAAAEPITFTLGYEDRRTGVRPVGAQLRVVLDNQTTITDIDVSANTSVFRVSLPPVAEPGAHTLTFTAPGDVYDDSYFDSARYNVDERVFTVGFLVSDEAVPFTPIISGACTVGEESTFYVTGFDPEGDDIAYEIDWTQNRSDIERIPLSGFVPSGSTVSVTHQQDNPGPLAGDMRLIDETGAVGEWVSAGTISCYDNNAFDDGEEGDGVGPEMSIRAVPVLVQRGDTTTLFYRARNVGSCDIIADVGGDRWTNVSVAAQELTLSTRAITEQTTYTLQCRDGDNNALPEVSTTVRIVPSWQEF